MWVDRVVVSLKSILQELGGCARWATLADAGVSQEALQHALRAGIVERPHRGCYVLPGTPRSVILATIFRASFTCLTWAVGAGLPVESVPDRVHLGVPASRAVGRPRSRPVEEVALHRHGLFPQDFALGHLDIAALCTSPLQQVGLVDAALRRGLVTHREVAECGLGDERRRTWLRGHVSASAQSLAETYARVAMREAGLAVRPQARIREVGSVDLLVEGALVVEVDGRSYHSDERQFALDRQRDRSATLKGLTTVRFTHNEVVRSLFDVVDEVVAVLWRRELAPPTLRTRMDAAARVSDPNWWR